MVKSLPENTDAQADAQADAAANLRASASPITISQLIVSFAKKDPALVVGYILFIAASTAIGVVGVTKVTAALYASASRGDKQGALKWLVWVFVLAIVFAVVQWGVEYMENLLDTEFTKYALQKAVKSVFDANDAHFLDLGPMQYRAFVRTSADSAREVFKQVVKAYAPNIVLIVVLIGFLFSLQWKYGVVFLTGIAVVVALFVSNYRPTIRSCRHAEMHLRGSDFRTFDILQALPTVVSAGQAQAEQVHVEKVTADAMQVRLDVTQAMVANNTLIAALLVITTMVVMLMAVWSMKHTGSENENPESAAAGATKVVTVLTLMATLQAKFQTINSTSERMRRLPYCRSPKRLLRLRRAAQNSCAAAGVRACRPPMHPPMRLMRPMRQIPRALAASAL